MAVQPFKMNTYEILAFYLYLFWSQFTEIGRAQLLLANAVMLLACCSYEVIRSILVKKSKYMYFKPL